MDKGFDLTAEPSGIKLIVTALQELHMVQSMCELHELVIILMN